MFKKKKSHLTSGELKEKKQSSTDSPHGGGKHKQSCGPDSLETNEEEWRTQCTARLRRVVSP